MTGFSTVAVVIGLGFALAHWRVVDTGGQRALSAVAFYVASPSLLFVTLESADLGRVFSVGLVPLVAAVLVTASVTAGVTVVRQRSAGIPGDSEGAGGTVIATMCSSYSNAGNLGLPIATYVLGDAALIAPLLLLQLLVLQPLALTVLDVTESPTRPSVPQILTRPLRNPVTVGSVLGLAVALSGVDVPEALHAPVRLVAGMSVPAMLLAYGVGLRLGPRPGRGARPAELGLAVSLKLLLQPAVALVTAWALGLDKDAMLAVVVISALPTAQNVFVIASRYDRGVLLARDAIFVSTVGCPAVILGAAALLG